MSVVACCGFVPPVALPVLAWAVDPGSDVAVKSWTAEQFGPDVAILRSDGGTPDARAPRADILLSCSGPDRRFKVSIPEGFSDGDAGGSALIATADRSDRRRVIARFKHVNASTIVISSGTSQSRDIAVAIGRMLLTKPAALDIVLSWGSGPVAFTKLKVVRVLVSLRPEDVAAVTRFIDACGRFPAVRTN